MITENHPFQMGSVSCGQPGFVCEPRERYSTVFFLMIELNGMMKLNNIMKLNGTNMFTVQTTVIRRYTYITSFAASNMLFLFT